jgi:hypothetical protein
MIQDLDERDDMSTCIDCGAPLPGEGARSYANAPASYLCFACAERRGGVYDEDEDRWTIPPDVSGLPDERRPHP